MSDANIDFPPKRVGNKMSLEPSRMLWRVAEIRLIINILCEYEYLPDGDISGTGLDRS